MSKQTSNYRKGTRSRTLISRHRSAASGRPSGPDYGRPSADGPAPTRLDPLLVPEREACRLLGGISRSTLYRLRKAGKITPVPLMGAVRYRVAEIEQIAAPAHDA